jgi:putative ABC transport system substrate-binding protein
MNRRAILLALLGGGTLAPLAVHAQQAGKLPSVGFLSTGTREDWSPWAAAFAQRMSELGWVEGQAITIHYRSADGRYESFAGIVAEFVRLNVDVIVAPGSAIPAAKRATSVIPIVFPVANEPVGSGYVTSLARPGGNVTGLSLLQADLAGKRLEILRELVPNLRRLGIIANVTNQGAALDMQQAQAAAHALGIEHVAQAIRRADEISSAFDALKGKVDAVYLVGDLLMTTNRVRIHTLATSAKLPVIFNSRTYVAAGGLISYGVNFTEHYRRAGDYVDKILRGAKPADLPVEQPTTFEFALNLTTAKALGIAIPQSILLRANEVIE